MPKIPAAPTAVFNVWYSMNGAIQAPDARRARYNSGIKNVVIYCAFFSLLFVLTSILVEIPIMQMMISPRRKMFGIMVFVLAWIFVSQILEMRLLGSIMDKLVSVGVIGLIVLFQEDIRKFLYNLGAHQRIRLLVDFFASDRTRPKEADKEAIDYFIKYAGCDNNGNQLDSSPMKGGIVLFATNNHNSSNPSDATPADYEKVIGVAALGPNFRKASYSDYGEYIDLCAPGGERPLLFGDDERVQILSTTGQHDYGYLYGASMACPHVAGVAALLVEKHGVGKRGFTAAQLEDLLLRSARSVDDRNPDYAGQLGMGCVDASAALAAGLDAADEAPFQLLANPVTNGTLTFRVTPQAAGEATLTVRNSIGNVVFRTALETRKYMSKSVDISRLSAGYYVLEYSCNGQTWTKRFVKY